MAINYEPPQAFDASISTAYGQLNQQVANREFALKSFEAQQSAQARNQSNANQQSQLAQHAYEFEQSQMPSGRDKFQAAQQMAQQEAHVGGQMAVQAQAQQFKQAEQERDFNYSDGIRLQNLQQQRSMITSNSNLSDAQKQELLAQVDPNISALTFQQRQTQMKQEKAQTTRMQHQNAQAATIQSLNTDMQARGALGRVVNLKDEDGNDLGPHQWDMQHGRYDPLPVMATRGGGGANAGQGQAARPMTEAQIASLSRSIDRDVRADPAFIGKPREEIDAEVASRLAVHRQRASGEQSQLAPPRPISLPDGAPLTQLPADQRQIVLGFNADQAVLLSEGSHLTDAEKAEARADIAKGRSLFRQYGQANSMPSQERAEFLAIGRRLDQMTGRLPDPAHPNGRPPRAAPPSNPNIRDGMRIRLPSGMSVSDLNSQPSE